MVRMTGAGWRSLAAVLALAVGSGAQEQGKQGQGKKAPSELSELRAEFERQIAELKKRIAELEAKQGGEGGAGVEDELEKLRREAGELAPKPSTEKAPEQAGELIGSLNKFNPSLTVFGDFTYTSVNGELRNENGDDVGDRFSVRETELDFRADIDPFAKGVAIFSLEEEAPGEFKISPEEVYVNFVTLPFDLRAKAGRFHTSFGSNNPLHTHDLPQTDRPLPVREFLGPDSDIESGGSLSWLVPGLHRPTLTLQYQILNGENEHVLSGKTSNHLAHLGRASAFFDLPPASYLEVGTSVLEGRADPRSNAETLLLGTDVLYKWRPAKLSDRYSFLLQGEGFHMVRRLPGETIHSNGAYGMAQLQLWNTYLGARAGWTEFANTDSGEAWSVSGWASYYTSEFMRLRIGLERQEDPRQDADLILFLQMTFVIGAHPPHPYWVNK